VGTHMWLLEQSACTTLKALGAAHMRGTKCLESAANRLLVEAIMYICLLSLKHKLHALADMMICIAFFVSFLLYRQQLRLVISIARHASASTLSGAQNFKDIVRQPGHGYQLCTTSGLHGRAVFAACRVPLEMLPRRITMLS